MRSIAQRLSGPCRTFQAASQIWSRHTQSYPNFVIHVRSYLVRRRYGTAISPDEVSVPGESTSLSLTESGRNSKVTASDCLHLAAFIPSRNFSIDTFEQLFFESDVNGVEDSRIRLVDQAEHSHDFQLWTQLLEFRVRLFGLEGAWTIWQGLRRRNIDLPVEGPDADYIWSLCVKAAFKSNSLPEIFQYAQGLYQRKKHRHHLLYDNIISLYLESGPERCYIWHRTLNQIDLPAPNTLSHLVDVAVQSRTSLRSFQKLYENSEDQAVYDSLITALCEKEEFGEACRWHDLLIRRKDFPTSASVVEPLRQHLAISGKTSMLKKITSELVESGASFSKTLPKTFKPNVKISREMMNRMLGEAYGIEPVKISDGFCARLFATKYFSLDFSMRCLASFGVEEIGPLALRELAVRCPDPQSVTTEVVNLRKLGVGVTDCTFSRMVLKLASESRREILSSLLESDQHPEVLEDGNIQKRLLAIYIHEKDWVQVQRTILVLSSTSTEPLVEAWNNLLQAYIYAKDRPKISQTVDDMLNYDVPITAKTISLSFHQLVSTKNPDIQSNAPSDRLEDLHFFTNLWLKVLRCGGHVPAAAWNQVLNYYGGEKRVDDLHRLCYWLASLYSKKRMPSISSCFGEIKGRSRLRLSKLAAPSSFQGSDRTSALMQVFTPNKIKSIILWSLQSGSPTSSQAQEKTAVLKAPGDSSDAASVTEPGIQSRGEAMANISSSSSSSSSSSISKAGWARGLSLLQDLRQRGVPVRTEDVRAACRQTLQILFGPRSKKPRAEVELMARNQYTLEQVIRHMNEVWDQPTLIAVPPHLIKEEEEVQAEGSNQQTPLAASAAAAAAAALRKYILGSRNRPSGRVRYLLLTDEAMKKDGLLRRQRRKEKKRLPIRRRSTTTTRIEAETNPTTTSSPSMSFDTGPAAAAA